MDVEVEEEKESKMHKLISTTPDWLDLPESIATNIILENLDIVDYIRFSAVCKKWFSIQKEHRIRYAPHPPPLSLSFPWLCSKLYDSEHNFDLNIQFYLPNRQKFHSVPLSRSLRANRYCKLFCQHGWLLLHDFDASYYLLGILNPVTGVQIKLPLRKPTPIALAPSLMSSPPTDSDCTIVTVDDRSVVYIYRINDNSGWIKTNCPTNTHGSVPIIFHNKIYYMKGLKKILIVDVLHLDQDEQIVEMNCSEICVDMDTARFKFVDFLGEMVAIISVYEGCRIIGYETITKFYIYRADFTTNKWVRMETLGDNALFFSKNVVFTLPVIDVGFEKNKIYIPGGLKGRGVTWRAFDLRTKNWIDGPPMSLPSPFYRRHGFSNMNWFLPTLDYYSVANTNGA